MWLDIRLYNENKFGFNSSVIIVFIIVTYRNITVVAEVWWVIR